MPTRSRCSIPLFAALILWANGAGGAERPAQGAEDAYAAAKSAEIDSMRVRLSAAPSASGTATLMEAEALLRRFRAAPPPEKATLRPQLDAAIATLSLELANGRTTP